MTLIPWYSSVTGRFGVAGGVETEGLWARDTVNQIVARQTEKKVFGCLPVTARGAARRQASEKPRRRKPRGEYAPAAVSVYGDLRRGSARLGRSRTELPLEWVAGSVILVGERGVGPVPACRRIWVLAAEVEAEGAIGRVWLLPAGYRRRTGGAMGAATTGCCS